MTCHEIAAEIKDITPAIEDIHFDFTNLTHPELAHWLSTMPAEHISRIRDFEMHGWGICHSEMYQAFHSVNTTSLAEHMAKGEHIGCAQDVEHETLEPGSYVASPFPPRTTVY